MFEALKLITDILAALFLDDLNILIGEPSDILASWFLILISSDFHLYLLILSYTEDFIIPSNFTISKINNFTISGIPITILGLIETCVLTPSFLFLQLLLSLCPLLSSLDSVVHHCYCTLKIVLTLSFL